MGIFSKENAPDEGRKRNAFDGSFQNNLTFQFGQLVPCMCREVIGGDSFRINAAYGLRFMPTAFPVQTKMRAKLDFFYVRYRNLWNQWKNFYMKTGKPDNFPVLSDSEKMEQSRTGSLGDYLGLPSTIVGAENILYSSDICMVSGESYPEDPYHATIQKYTKAGNPPTSVSYNLVNESQGSEYEGYKFLLYGRYTSVEDDAVISSIRVSYLKQQPTLSSFNPPSGIVGKYANKYYKIPFESVFPASFIEAFQNGKIIAALGQDVINHEPYFINTQISYQDIIPLVYYHEGNFFAYVDNFNASVTDVRLLFGVSSANTSDFINVYIDNTYSNPILFKSANENNEVVEATEALGYIPYEISALPFRAYEQIYNAFYRDDRNNPYMVDGVNDPNVFLPTYEGGVDDNKYRIHYRNWEQDFLTTALPSPQYGNAPLVGITTGGVASFQLDDGSTITSQLQTAENGDTIVGFSTTANPSVNRSLVELASSGISINDLRGVNSLQRYLEAKYRSALRYRDQMKTHFGVNIKYDELDMPEFLGSVTCSVNVDQVNQTSASVEDNPLGSYAGQLSAMGGSNGYIQHYCDEPGLIIGIISVVPVPCYSQLLPKHFTKVNDAFDYYFSEFAHLGYQAIPYREVCPLQAALNGVNLDSTFGYQRPWYDYISAQDEIHGQFRTTLNNFVLARVFNQVPSLNEEFLTVRPESLNDIFTISEVENPDDPTQKIQLDTILGQIHFDITMQRPIPRLGVPRLE